MPDDDGLGPSLPPRRRQPIDIAKWPRIGAALAGVIGVVAGGIAVFITNKDAGPVALLVLGTLLILISMVGYLPTRVRWEGKGEIEWQREVGEVVASIVESSGAGSTPEVLRGIDDLSRIAPDAAAAPMRAVTYERLVQFLLETIGERIGVTVQTATTTGRIRWWVISLTSPQAWVVSPSGHRVVVEIRQRVREELEIALLKGRLASREDEAGGVDALLLITSEALPKRIARELAEYPRLEHALVRTVADEPQLERALRKALGEGSEDAQ